MKFTPLLVLALFFSVVGYCQPSISPYIIASSGHEFSGGGLTVCYTVGEMAVTFSGSGLTGITQGFNQPEELQIPTTSLLNVNKSENGILVYPNPAKNVVNIQYNMVESGSVKLKLEDINGCILYEQDEYSGIGSCYEINTEALPNGVYILNLTLSSNRGKTSAFSKQISINH